jgi:site-specific DNA-methyltransferase (adenine-specific)
MDEVLEFKQMIVWDKGPMGMGWHYRRSYETVLVGVKKGAAHKWFDTSMKIENIIRPNMHGIKKIIPSKEEHPTVKPKALSSFFINLHTQKGDKVLDPFMGSGTTGISCKEFDRDFLGIELDEIYYKLAQKRIANTQEMML